MEILFSFILEQRTSVVVPVNTKHRNRTVCMHPLQHTPPECRHNLPQHDTQTRLGPPAGRLSRLPASRLLLYGVLRPDDDEGAVLVDHLERAKAYCRVLEGCVFLWASYPCSALSDTTEPPINFLN